MTGPDPRLEPPRWSAAAPGRLLALRARLLAVAGAVLAVVYFWWLLQPRRVGDPLLYGLLVTAELFNVVQALGFWWTCGHQRPAPEPPARAGGETDVDVFIPVYDEPVDVVEPTVAAAMALRGARVRVALLDDGNRPAMEALAARHGARYLRRTVHQGAKAGNINHALGRTSGAFVVVFDCDHVPAPEFLERTLPHLADDRVAFVQTPQYYANADRSPVAAAAWAQQALFFGAIARGKNARGAMFCCGTNMVFRRAALADVGGFPEGSITEDFQLSVLLHGRGWRSVYLPEVLAAGLGPEDMASYVGQQHRWARGCLGSIADIVRADLPWRLKGQYLLSAGFFLSGWTALLYMALPVIRIVTGAQPLADASADQFLLHFAPYFGLSLLTLAVVGVGTYTWEAFTLAFSTFWIHIHASLAVLFGRRGRFVVTPKKGVDGVQVKPVLVPLVAVAGLMAAAGYGLASGHDAGTLNNVAFAGLHVTVLLHGVWPALRPAAGRRAATARPERVAAEAA